LQRVSVTLGGSIAAERRKVPAPGPFKGVADHRRVPVSVTLGGSIAADYEAVRVVMVEDTQLYGATAPMSSVTSRRREVSKTRARVREGRKGLRCPEGSAQRGHWYRNTRVDQ
jgi:hypothetical protein